MEGIKFTFSTWISCWPSRVKRGKECFTWLGGLPGNNGRNAVVEAAARLRRNQRYFYLSFGPAACCFVLLMCVGTSE